MSLQEIRGLQLLRFHYCAFQSRNLVLSKSNDIELEIENEKRIRSLTIAPIQMKCNLIYCFVSFEVVTDIIGFYLYNLASGLKLRAGELLWI